MSEEKLLMSEAATLYYEKKYTQQEVADLMHLSRQTVSKLLNDAIKENIVEIKIHDPEKDCKALEQQLCETFGIEAAVVCSVSSKNEAVRRLMTVRAAARYMVPLIENGGQKIAVSWGRTIEELIAALPDMETCGNIVFPLFGATDHENTCFLSNEMARSMADKIGACIKYAWFPYLPDTADDRVLLKKTSYYKTVQSLWNNIDIAVVGIGNTDILRSFEETFGCGQANTEVIGDVATHFFGENGELLDLYDNTLCATADNIKNAKKTIAVACGNSKVRAITGALRTGLINVLVTDEYTAKQIVGE